MKKRILLLPVLFTSSFAEQAPPEIDQTSSGFEMSWDGAVGRSYFFMSSFDLISWSYFPEMKYGVGSYAYGFSSTADKMFVRLAYVDAPWVTTLQEAEDADFDNDGIPNIFELEDVGSDPLDKDSAGGDTDADGLNDGWEDYYFGNLTTADPNAILGGDGLTNKEKSDLGLDPNVNYDQATTVHSSTYSYNSLGRLTGSTGTTTTTYGYDPEGNITSAQ